MAIRLYTPEKEYFYFGTRMEYLCEHLKASAGNTDMTAGSYRMRLRTSDGFFTAADMATKLP